MPFAQAQRDRLECDALCYGAMMSARSGLSLVGSALLGRLSDRLGRKACLWLALGARVFSIAVFGATDSILMMWVGMVPTALLNQQYEVLKALLADFAAGEGAGAAERGGKQGMLGMAAGLGFMGMALGTFIPSQQAAAAIALVFLALSGVVIFVLPGGQRIQKGPAGGAGGEAAGAKGPPGGSSSWFSMFNLPSARTPGAYVIFSLRVLMGFAFHVFISIWNPTLKKRFDFGPQEHAKLMGFIGLSYALSQGLLSKPILKYGSIRTVVDDGKKTESKAAVADSEDEGADAAAKPAIIEDPTPILLGCCLVLGAGRVLSVKTTSMVVVYLTMSTIVISLGVFNSAISSAATLVAPPEEAGGFFGILSSVESTCGIAGPAFGGLIHRIGGDTGALATVVTLYAICVGIVVFGWRRFIAVRAAPKEKAD
uniref:Major facilitator superfamily (MFS) profile domain-containing protein n=1 Tax=Phaeomonas parva TaxID=124430 RepID=A0A6U4JWA0_9STRA